MSRRVTGMAELIAAAEELLQGGSKRRFLAIAGAPGSGKSAMAEQLRRELESRHPRAVAILPMDGFHYDDAVLHQMNRHPWKGAPDTFDVGGLCSILKRLHEPQEGAVAIPVFDRTLEISRGSAQIISEDVRLVIVEGNYLLLDEDPWRCLAPFFDLSVMIDVPEQELRRRLHERWVGFGLNEEEIARKLDGNDLPNARTVRDNSRDADIIYRQK